MCSIIIEIQAGVSELADETDSKSVVSNGVWVRVPPPAPKITTPQWGVVIFYVDKWWDSKPRVKKTVRWTVFTEER